MSLVLITSPPIASPSISKSHSSTFLSPSSLRRRFNLRQNHHQRLFSLPYHFRTSHIYPIHCSSMPLQEFPISTSQLQDWLLYSRAFWVTESIIAWNVDIGHDGACFLYASQTAGLSVTDAGIQGHFVKFKLEKDDGGLPENVVAKFPHIQDYNAFKVPSALDAKPLLKCQLAVAAFDSFGKCSNATGLQLPGILDELFSYDGPLGAHYSKDVVSLNLWAPTAQAVRVCIYRDAFGKDPMEIVQLMEVNGVWSITGPKDWEGCYYMYEVSVYHPSTLRIEKCYANDPYARGYAGCLSLRTIV